MKCGARSNHSLLCCHYEISIVSIDLQLVPLRIYDLPVWVVSTSWLMVSGLATLSFCRFRHTMYAHETGGRGSGSGRARACRISSAYADYPELQLEAEAAGQSASIGSYIPVPLISSPEPQYLRSSTMSIVSFHGLFMISRLTKVSVLKTLGMAEMCSRIKVESSSGDRHIIIASKS